MTEKEAKTKWCPFARAVQRTPFQGEEGSAGNRWADDEAQHPDDGTGIQLGTFCIGSACMAWRILYAETQYTPVVETRYGVPVKPVQTYTVRGEELGGYCGLAGKP